MNITEYIHPTIPFLFAEFEKYSENEDDWINYNIPLYRVYNGHKHGWLLLWEEVLKKMWFVNKNYIISEFNEEKIIKEITEIVDLKDDKTEFDLKMILRKYFINYIPTKIFSGTDLKIFEKEYIEKWRCWDNSWVFVLIQFLKSHNIWEPPY